MTEVAPCPNPVSIADARALVGILARLEAVIWAGGIGAAEAEQFRLRLEKDGLVTAGSSDVELRQALGNLNQRLRYAIGEYPGPPPAEPARR
ncbi:hypothetical protein [Naasia sp. SYSU D00948]|uniref:hypothetical protein n=1 Tax=Naasia sp. SYSU D00948 TaxID=2817379 RepID=UPI001B306F99|nr:hypothetical protein [Naasia sp. SYSU D00948]